MTKILIPSLKEILSTLPQDPQKLRELEKKLRPRYLGRYGSTEGFMGINESLKEILISDYITLRNLGITYSQIADRLDSLMEVGGRGGEIGRFKFGGEISCGEQLCPWEDAHSCNQYIMWLVPKNGKKGFEPGEVFNALGSIEISGLMPHLIREHYFFEGKESNYRINPEDIYEILNEEIIKY
jgi:hypothetical protein